jgi:plastocyanin
MVIGVACGGGDTGASIEGQAVTVQMFDNRYEYTDITVPVGGTVTYVGAGHNPHNATASDGSWGTEEVFGSLEQHDGDSATISFDTPGTYTFYCTFHGTPDGGGMAGTIIVEAP